MAIATIPIKTVSISAMRTMACPPCPDRRRHLPIEERE
jgi:hypothetical protein